MEKNLSDLLAIPANRLDSINAVLLDPEERVMKDFLKVVEKYGEPEEINRRHTESRQLNNLFAKVKARNPAYIEGSRMADGTTG